MPVSYTHLDVYKRQIDAGLFAKTLKEYSLAKGLNYIDTKIEKVELNQENGSIKSILLDSGKSLEADLFIDCSGFEALLIGKALGNEFESYEKYLLTNAAWAIDVYKRQQLYRTTWF